MVYRDENLLVAQAEDAWARAIPDVGGGGDPVRSVLHIGELGTTRRILVEVDLTHPSVSDVSITLVAPSGRRALIYSQHPSDDPVHALRWDSESSVKLEPLLGEPSAGPWQLIVQDSVPKDPGSLDRFALTLEIAGPPRT